MVSTTKDRAAAVVQANANAALEGFEPTPYDLTQQTRFISGEISLADMLEEALQDAAAAGQGEAP